MNVDRNYWSGDVSNSGYFGATDYINYINKDNYLNENIKVNEPLNTSIAFCRSGNFPTCSLLFQYYDLNNNEKVEPWAVSENYDGFIMYNHGSYGTYSECSDFGYLLRKNATNRIGLSHDTYMTDIFTSNSGDTFVLGILSNRVPTIYRTFAGDKSGAWNGSKYRFEGKPIIAFDINKICFRLALTVSKIAPQFINSAGVAGTDSSTWYRNCHADFVDFYRYYHDDSYEYHITKYPFIINVFLMPYMWQAETSGERGFNNYFSYYINDFTPTLHTKFKCTMAMLTNGEQYEFYPNPNFRLSDDKKGFIVCGISGALNSEGFSHYVTDMTTDTEWTTSRPLNQPFVMGDIDKDFNIVLGNLKGSKREHYIWTTVTASEERLIQMACTYGLPIALDEQSAKTGTLTDDKICLPTRDKYGDITGYTKGVNNVNNPMYNWEGLSSAGWTDDGSYSPDKPPKDKVDPNKYTTSVKLNTPTLNTLNKFNRTFALTSNQVELLSDFLWNNDETIFNEIVKGLSLMGGNPIDGIIDLRLYPFEVTSRSDLKTIVIGRTPTNISGVPLSSNTKSIFDLGNCTFFKHFDNFLDYEPYTTAELYIPFCGKIPIPTSIFMGHTISAKLIVDFVTGMGTAIIFCDDIPYTYLQGSIGINITVSGTNSSAYSSRILSSVIGNATSVIGNVTSGNTGGTVAGAVNLATTPINQTIYERSGGSTPNCSLYQPKNAYFVIQRPIASIPENYAHTVGYACRKTGSLSEFNGFTVISQIELNTSATNEEKTEIISLLQNGIYI